MINYGDILFILNICYGDNIFIFTQQFWISKTFFLKEVHL